MTADDHRARDLGLGFEFVVIAVHDAAIPRNKRAVADLHGISGMDLRPVAYRNAVAENQLRTLSGVAESASLHTGMKVDLSAELYVTGAVNDAYFFVHT